MSYIKKQLNIYFCFLVFCVVFFLFNLNYTFAATRTIANGGGNYNSTGTWVEGVVPTSSDDVVATATSGQLTVNVDSVALSVDFTNYTNTLTVSATRTLTVTNNFKLVPGMAVAGTGTLKISGTSTITSASLTWSGSLNLSGANTVTLGDSWTVAGDLSAGNSGAGTTIVNGNTINVAGNFTTNITSGEVKGTTAFVLNGTGTWSHPGFLTTAGGSLKNNLTINTAGTITISGNVGYDTGILTYTAGIVTTTGSTLYIANSTTINVSGITWNNVVFVNGGTTTTYTLSSDLNIGGNFTVGTTSIFAVINGNKIYIGGNLTVKTTSGTVSGTTAIVLNGTGTWSHSTRTSGSLQNNLTINTAGTITVSGAIGYNTGTLTYTSGTVTTTGSTIYADGITTINTSGMTWANIAVSLGNILNNNSTSGNGLALSGDLTGAGRLTQGINAILTLGGLASISQLVVAASGNTVNYNGATQTCKVVAYYNLTLSGTGTKTCAVVTVNNNLTYSGSGAWTLTAALAVSGNLSVTSGTMTTGGFNYTITGTTEVSGGSLTNTNDTRPKTYIGLVTVDGGTLDGASSNIVFRGGITQTSGVVNITGTAIFNTNHQNLNGTMSINTVSVPSPIVLTNKGILTVGTDLSGTGTFLQFTNSPTLLLGGTSTITTLTTTAIGNTTEYISTTSGQTVRGITYDNLIIDNRGQIATLDGNIIVNSNLTITRGNLDVSRNNYQITLGGNWSNSGIFSAENGALVLSGTTQQILSGDMTGGSSFYDLTITNNSGVSAVDNELTGFVPGVTFSSSATATNNYVITTANTRVKYNSGSIYTFTNINWNGQASGSKIYFRNSATSGTWLLNVFGTQTAVSYVDVSRSYALGGNTITNDSTVTNSGNNTNWSFIIPTTTLGNGTDPVNSTVAPDSSITDLDKFILSDNVSTDSVTALTVTLATGTYAGLSEVRITSDDNGLHIFRPLLIHFLLQLISLVALQYPSPSLLLLLKFASLRRLMPACLFHQVPNMSLRERLPPSLLLMCKLG